MIITIVSNIFGFGREMILAYFYGTSSVSDAYLIAITIPTVIFGFISSGIAVGYIPIYSKIVQDNGEFEANRFTNNLINMTIIICTVFIVFGLLFTDQIVKIFAWGFEAQTLCLTVQFTKLSLLTIYFIGVISIFSGYLQIKGNYVIPALIGVPLNVIIILSIVLSTMTNIVVLSVGFVIATASQILLMVPYMRKNRYKHKLIFDVKDKHIINIAYITLPVIIGVSVNQINVLVDRTIASQIAVGGISALNYANKLNGFVEGIFIFSITIVLYPIIAKMFAENDLLGFKHSISKAIIGISLLVIPAAVGSMLFSVPIVTVLFGRGAFEASAISMTSYALFFYSIGMIGFGLRDVLLRAFYSMQDITTPIKNAIIGLILNIILNIILSKYMGIGGLALATSIAAITTTGLLFISLQKKIGPLGMKQMSISFLKIVFTSLIMGLIAKLSFFYLTSTISQSLSLLIAIVIGIVVYFTIINFMKIEDADEIINAMKDKLGQIL